MKKEEPTNVVYVKEFENGGVYVGVSNQFETRMRRHERDAKNGKLDYPVYRAMRKYTHETKIVFRSEDYEEVLKKEIDLIKEYKDKGTMVYNITDGGQGHLGHKPSAETRKKLSESRTGYAMPESTKQKLREINLGKKQSKETIEKRAKALRGKTKNLKDLDAILSKPSRRDSFKSICKSHNLDYLNFKEEFSHKDNRGKKYFNYTLDLEGTESRKESISNYSKAHPNNHKNIGQPLSYWANKGTYITSFKKVCKRWGWDFNNFDKKLVETKEHKGKKTLYYSFHLKEGKTPFPPPYQNNTIILEN